MLILNKAEQAQLHRLANHFTSQHELSEEEFMEIASSLKLGNDELIEVLEKYEGVQLT